MQVLIADRRLTDTVIWDRLPDSDPYASFPDRDPFCERVQEAGGEYRESTGDSEAAFIEECRNSDIIVTFKHPFPERVLASIGNPALIIRNGVGYDNIDINAATRLGIPVANVPGNCNDDVSSHAVALMLGAAHEVVANDAEMRATSDLNRHALNQLYGGTCGIVGLGRIGRRLVPKVRGLGMDLIAFDPYLDDDIFAALDIEAVSFPELLQRADAISIHAPLTGETRHLFGTPEFRQMKLTAVLVNTARGPIVAEDDLVEAVRTGEIWGAGLDVFEVEPPTDSPVIETDRIVCSSHSAGISPAAEQRAIEIAGAEIERVLRGEHPRNVVNPAVFQRADRLINPESDPW